MHNIYVLSHDNALPCCESVKDGYILKYIMCNTETTSTMFYILYTYYIIYYNIMCVGTMNIIKINAEHIKIYR